MVIAAEFTTAALVLWTIGGLGVGLVLGALLRPWLIADRLREDYEAELGTERQALETRDRELADATAALATATSTLEQAEADRVRLDADLATATSRVGVLEQKLETARLEKEANAERLTAETAKVNALEMRIEELQSHGASTAAVDDLRRELESCRATVARHEATIGELRAAAAGVPAEPEDGGRMPDKAFATLRVAEIARRTRGDDPHREDDLERVHGIGPTIASLLRELEITSFRQIARFQPDDIAYVAAALESFPDRIERDNWMASAAALHEEKYGEPA